jgi:aminoglycoside phosphotransferase (APT) family kinase protein
MSAAAGALIRRHPVADLGPLDASRSPALARELPGLAMALDPAAMSERLHQALLSGSSDHTIRRCVPGHATYLPGDGCLVRYELTVAGGRRMLVNGRLFRSAADCRRHLRHRLAPLARRTPRRALPGPFTERISAVEELNLTVSRFPIDGELPALIDAADPVIVGRLLRAAPGSRSGRCRVRLGHYGRRNRCVLVYELRGAAIEPAVIYGKVAADARGATAAAAIAALQDRGHHLPVDRRVTVPRALGYHHAMKLLLLESVPGTPLLSSLFKAESGGGQASRAGIEQAVDGCAEVAAALHTSGVELAPRRPVGQELTALGVAVGAVRRITPTLGDLLLSVLAEVEEWLAGSGPMRPRLSHGDFRHSQVLFEGSARALVDLDTLCRAEPALDLGHFLAYLRLSVAKGPAPMQRLDEELADRFLAAYLAAARPQDATEAVLRERVAACEAVALVRLAIHSWYKFKPARLATAITLLEERLSCRTP